MQLRVQPFDEKQSVHILQTERRRVTYVKVILLTFLDKSVPLIAGNKNGALRLRDILKKADQPPFRPTFPSRNGSGDRKAG